MKIRIKKTSLIDIWLGICMFIVIFNPPILNINLLHIVALFSWLYIVSNQVSVNHYISSGFWKKLSLALMCFMLYNALMAVVNSNPIINVTIDYIYWIFEVIPFCICAVVSYLKRGMTTDDILGLLNNVALVQAVLAILSFLIPSVQQFFVDRMIAYGYGSSLLTDMSYRQYGFAADLSSYAIYFMSAMACVSLYYFMRDGSVIHVIRMVLMSFASIINARTGAVIIIAGVIIILAQKKEKSGHFFLKILSIGLVAISVPIVLGLVSRGNQDTYTWLLGGYSDIVRMLHGNVGGSTSFFYYYSQFWKLPTDVIIFIFGNGCQMMGSAAKLKYGFSTDVGFINDLWKNGLLCSLILYFGYFKVFNQSLKQSVDDATIVFIRHLLIACFIIVNLKGFFFVKQGISTFALLMIILVYAIKRDHQVSSRD